MIFATIPAVGDFKRPFGFAESWILCLERGSVLEPKAPWPSVGCAALIHPRLSVLVLMPEADVSWRRHARHRRTTIDAGQHRLRRSRSDCGATEFHASARTGAPSAMKFIVPAMEEKLQSVMVDGGEVKKRVDLPTPP